MSRKRWIWAGLGAALLAVAGAAWLLRDDLTYAHIATGYAAKETCSCVHVSGRALQDCIDDYPEEVRSNISVEQDGARMRASVLFGAVRAEAVFEEGYGCRLEGAG